MRLDHLLSREQADPEGEASNRGRLRTKKFVKEGAGKRGSAEGAGQEGEEPEMSEERTVTLKSVSFSGF